jgi:hypothetical protein
MQAKHGLRNSEAGNSVREWGDIVSLKVTPCVTTEKEKQALSGWKELRFLPV